MGTLILDESKGRVAKTKEQQEAQQQSDSSMLREEILTSCEKAGIQSTPELIAAALQRFSYSHEKVHALSIYSDIDHFMKDHKHNAPTIHDAMAEVDKRAIKKQELYQQLEHYASVGDMKSYRSVREEYARL